ncbi:unnamed protein product [Hydatigera taeniaeformis]|uniref:Recep_L_domain domain-containing protein n=1 Tax=Hydatigena taeniaeformis TaxID=6205 RepID=A0A0R3WQU4_HYDTA|nr:unnamed protein product [Hydatigera taeniaeformis]
MLALHLLALLLCFIHVKTLSPEAFPTIDEVELIAHELINPFTPYFRDPKYRGKRICKGFSTWQDALFDNYEKLKAKFARNCSHILGNLIISEIRPNEDIGFLNSVEEVSGYVFIRRVTKPHFGLPKLRIIRGEESVQIRGQAFTLLVTETYTSNRDFMLDIEFPSLEAILMHGVGFFDNPGLCYAPFSVNWDDILEYPDLQPVILVPMNSRSATSHWITACATRYADASRASIHSTTSPSFMNESNATTRLRRNFSENLLTAVALNNTQSPHSTNSMPTVQPPTVSFSTFETNLTEVVLIKAVSGGTQKGDENPEVFLDRQEGGTTVSTTETANRAENLTHTTQDPSGSSSEFGELFTNETFRVLWNLSSETGPQLKWKCHDSCFKRNGRSFCWGPGVNQCQIPTRFYDVLTSAWKVNKEGRVALGHMCVSKCPDGFLLDGDHCVLKCSRPGTQQVRNVCVQCPPTGCPKSGFQLLW